METKKLGDKIKYARINAMRIWKEFPYKFDHQDKNTIEITIVKNKGFGGFGYTYQGTYRFREGSLSHWKQKRDVAIKEFFLKEGYCERDIDGESVIFSSEEKTRKKIDKYRERFIKEAEILSKIQEDNLFKANQSVNKSIVKVLHAFNANNTSYYVMEYIDGLDLHNYIKNSGPLDFELAWNYLKPVCQALSMIHADYKFAHRDISPQNILVDSNDNRLVLIDFGNCKIGTANEDGFSRTAPAAHNAYYSAPELIQNNNITYPIEICITQDIYSLALVLYKMITGKTPGEYNDQKEDRNYMFYNLLSSSIKPIIKKATSKQIGDRYQNLNDFIKACDDAVLKERTNNIKQDAIIKITPSITIEDLVKHGPICINLPIDDNTLDSEIIEGLSWRNLLGQDMLRYDYQVGYLKFKRVTINAKLDEHGNYQLNAI